MCSCAKQMSAIELQFPSGLENLKNLSCAATHLIPLRFSVFISHLLTGCTEEVYIQITAILVEEVAPVSSLEDGGMSLVCHLTNKIHFQCSVSAS